MNVVEEWRVARCDARYFVSNLGRVRFGSRKPRNPKPRKNGRIFVTINVCGKISCYGVSRMVLEAFRGPAPPGCTGSHLNGIPWDNRLDNLAWETHSENCLRKAQHGTRQSGAHNGQAKLTQRQVDEIRRSPESSRKIAPSYGVSDTHVRRIRQGANWT